MPLEGFDKGINNMSAPTIRSDYDGLKNIAQIFTTQGGDLQSINQQLRSNIQTLDKDWVGQGAQAFKKEMSDSVMPSMNRLQQAMVEAASVTKKISAAMKQAETDSSGCFHVN